MKVAFTGLQGVGKSEVARCWAELVKHETGIEPEEIDLAEPLKIAVEELLDDAAWLTNHRITVWSDVLESNKQDFRVVLQELGRLVRKYVGDAALINEALIDAQDKWAYIPNLRMPNEFKAFAEDGWLIVGLVCDDETRLKRLEQKYGRVPTPEEATHETEQYILPMIEAGACHIVLENGPDTDPRDLALFIYQAQQVTA